MLLSGQEAAIRQAFKESITAKYGFTDWNDAPRDALREFDDFLKSRMEAT